MDYIKNHIDECNCVDCPYKNTNFSISGSAKNAPKPDTSLVIKLLREFNNHMYDDYRNAALYIYKFKELRDFLEKSEVWNAK